MARGTRCAGELQFDRRKRRKKKKRGEGRVRPSVPLIRGTELIGAIDFKGGEREVEFAIALAQEEERGKKSSADSERFSGRGGTA